MSDTPKYNDDTPKYNDDTPKYNDDTPKCDTKDDTPPMQSTKRKLESETPSPKRQKLSKEKDQYENKRQVLPNCRSVDCYEKISRIQEGTYGVVYKARDKETNEIYALKKIKYHKELEGFPITSLREIAILGELRHPNIVHVKEVVAGTNSMFMVMEYVEHDLKTLMTKRMKNRGFSQSEVKCLMQQLLEGVAYLHENWVIHRDLKTSNLLMNNKGILKICDFGMARFYGDPIKPYTPLVVTRYYRAPELLLGAKTYTTAVDMWSVGCIFAELLTKKVLFQGSSDLDQIDKIFKILGVPSEEIWEGFDELPAAKNFAFKGDRINKLRTIFPPVTFGADQPFLGNEGFDLLCKLLTYDPKKRITAKEALQHPYFHTLPRAQIPEMMPTYPDYDDDE